VFGILFLDRDLEPVLREVHRGARIVAGRHQLLHVLLIRRRKDVGGGTLLDRLLEV
jgi:hypothetical protein